jgi:hypothetical protein
MQGDALHAWMLRSMVRHAVAFLWDVPFFFSCSIFATMAAACGGRVAPLGDEGAILPDADAREAAVDARDTSPPGDTATVFEGGADEGSSTFSTCGECVTASCRVEGDACLASPSCVRGVECVNACLDAACIDACIASEDTRVVGAPLHTLMKCVDSHCRALCLAR